MNRLAVVWAVFLKDLRLAWPLAALCAVLILAKSLYTGGGLAQYLPLVAAFASSLFVLGLVHQDAPASLRHEWLTRPIGTLELVLAKALLAGLVVLLPAALGPALAAARDGASVAEAVLSALGGAGTYLAVGFGLLVVAAVTSTLLEAAGVVFALFLLIIFVPPVVQKISGVSEAVLYLGSGWVVVGALGLVGVAGGLVALWLQYAARSASAARAAFGVTLAAVAGTGALLSSDVVFAVQQAATGPDPAAHRFTVALAPGCFDASTLLDPFEDGESPWTPDQRNDAGFGAIAFTTAARGQGLPGGWRMRVSDVDAAWLDRSGAVLQRLRPAPFTRPTRTAADGALENLNVWLLRRDRFPELAQQAAGLRLDYSLALLAPAHVAEIPADGVRRRLPGLGACAAIARSASAVQVSCFKAGRQADWLTARLAGAPADQEVAGDYPDYAPGLVRRTAGKRYQMMLRHTGSGAPPRVIVTAYEARAHVRRAVTAPGVLGGPPSACPAPKA